MNKEQKEISKFLLYLFACIIIPVIHFWLLSFFIMRSCESGVYMCGFLQLALAMFCVRFFQVFSLIGITALTINNTKSKILYRIFNQSNEYILLLFFFIIIEFAIKYFQTNDDIFYYVNKILSLTHEYFGIGISLLNSYLCVFCVILLNRVNIRLNMKK